MYEDERIAYVEKPRAAPQYYEDEVVDRRAYQSRRAAAVVYDDGRDYEAGAGLEGSTSRVPYV